MDINVNVTINAPVIEGLLQSFIASWTGPITDAKDAKAAEEVKPTTTTRTKKEKAAAAAESAEVVAAKEEAAAAAPAKNEEKPVETKPVETKPVVTLEAVREKLTAISRAGKKTEVKELITSFGAEKLTDIPEDKYAEVLEAAEAL
ncbi:hypothetical protein [Anaerospora hongkongensis]|uniref:hypothetical protein n=1 Tax=Anaerospora hongkongensis TaxID=244830 RepID=UPI00289DF57D|nr:hypothetical protein [Anaerospora hongkongensis]